MTGGVVMKHLKGKVTLVTGATRGIGKGIAIGLGEAGATVYITGRSLNNSDSPDDIGMTPNQQLKKPVVSALPSK
jgi:NAD(P)-dependent dehydrogenase (short-subunit alcohol dehydrogenase family)